MKILHTSDLHLGRSLLEESLIEDQKYILNEIVKIIKDENIDACIIAGDVYDKSIPNVDAVNMFDEFLNELYKMNTKVFITSGNHDSSDRLSYGSKIFNNSNIYISSIFNGNIDKISVGNVNIYMLPFIKPFHLKRYLDEEISKTITNSNDMMKYVLNTINVDKSKKNILIAHEYVTYNGTNPDLCDSESFNLGTLDSVDASVFKDFDYVALGHVHRPQRIMKDTIRYSGSPLKYSFSEVMDKKSVVIIDTNDIDNIKLKELKPLRNMRILKGTFEEIMKKDETNDLIKVELEDENIIYSPMEEIRKKFPNAISLSFKTSIQEEVTGEIDTNLSNIELFKNFFKIQNNRDINTNEEEYLNNLINTLEEGDL